MMELSPSMLKYVTECLLIVSDCTPTLSRLFRSQFSIFTTPSFTSSGWLDMVSGSTTYATYNAKIEGSTHVFVMDYKDLGNVTDENSRMIIKGKVYDITFIDNPMELDQQLEIYLNYLGGQ